MGYKEISLKMPTDYSSGQIEKKIEKKLKIRDFSWQTENKSLDARKKTDIHWLLRIAISSKEIKEGKAPEIENLFIPYKKTNKKAVVVGSGPAGFFAALVLQQAGIQTTLLERGPDVAQRTKDIDGLEKKSKFTSNSNYAFGEGGAGTFSDGKLTSRSKHISKEKRFIISSYIDAGAPKEIAYMAHPHVGSDNLKIIVKNLRERFIELGGTILFDTMLEDLTTKNGSINTATTTAWELEADYFILATGHSAFETYRMLLRLGVSFQHKNFAIGSRLEHPQEIINQAQWGHKRLPGVKAAEYRLTSKNTGKFPVFTFCMCPGGTVVPAAAYQNTNIVNGMSLYNRDNKFANAACVAGMNLPTLLGKDLSPLEALDWLGELEESFFQYSNSYQAPYCSIKDFLTESGPSRITESSYPLELKPAPLWEILPKGIAFSIKNGLKEFCQKVKGFDSGIMMGLESKTSAPIQVLRDKSARCDGFKNLYMVGEGSGHSGGIISSGADGIKAAMQIIAENGHG
jgi:uncharacterized protein